MADISKIKIGETEYDVKDAVARAQGAGVIGFAEGGDSLIVRGDCVFGLFNFGREGLGAFTFDSSNDMSTGPINMQYDGYEATVIANEYGFYIIFGADEIIAN